MAESFTPTETFEAEVNGRNNRYIQGQVYTARDGETWDDLRAKMRDWESQGKITMVARRDFVAAGTASREES